MKNMSINLKSYDILIKNNLDDIKKSFIQYFGDKYRDVIEERINSIMFCWYKHPLLDSFCNKYFKNIDNKLIDNKNNEIIGSTYDIKEYKNLLENMLDVNKNILGSNIEFCIGDEIKSFVLFPCILCNDKNLIHEIEHVVVFQALCYVEDKKYWISKSGLRIQTKEEMFFEELINERSAIDITKIFHDMKCTVLENDGYIKISNVYDDYLGLIDMFYNKYSSVLKIARITDNYNLLYKYVDKDIFKQYVCFIYKLYEENKKIDDNDILIAKKYVMDMKKDGDKKLKLVKD